MAAGMIHLNKNILCAIDFRYSGGDPKEHEIVQIAIMPLDSAMSPNKKILPFFCDIKPVFPGNYEKKTSNITEGDYDKIVRDGLDRWAALDLFDIWYHRLDLPKGKNIHPLSYNWVECYPFLENWVGGPRNMDYYFDRKRYRDLVNSAHFLNDYYDFHIERCPFPKLDFQYICLQNKIPRERPHDALLDCLYIGQNYQLMMRDSYLRFPMQ